MGMGMPEPRSTVVDIGGRYLHVREWDGAGETVIIAHGVTGCSADHSPLARRLNSAGYHVLAADAPGCGKSDPPTDTERGFGLGAFANDFCTMLDQRAKGPVRWIGASKGGGLGIRLAGQFPDHVHSLLLYDVGVSLPVPMIGALAKRLAEPPVFPTLLEFRGHLARFFERNNCLLSPERLDEIALGWSRRTDDGRFTYHYDPRTAAQFAHCPEDFDLMPQWEAIRCPVLVLKGGNSGVLPNEELAEMLARNPHAMGRELPGAEHVNMLDDPQLQDIIITFLKDN